MPDLNYDWTPSALARKRKLDYLRRVGNEGNESPPDNEVDEFEEKKDFCSINDAMNSHRLIPKTSSKYFSYKVQRRVQSEEKPPSMN
jgi:hypothetical protein